MHTSTPLVRLPPLSLPVPALPGAFRLSVVMPVRDAIGHLRRTVPALLAAAQRDGCTELVFVDNGSTDGSLEWLRALPEPFIVVEAPGARVGAVRNRGAAVATGEVLCFVDADCLVEADFCARVRRAAMRPGLQLFGSRYRLPTEPHWIEATWTGLHRQSSDGPVAYLPGGNLIVRRRVFEHIGGFDGELVAGEDADFCRRALSVGAVPTHVADVGLVHLGNPKSLTAFYRQQRWHARGTRLGWRTLLRDRPQVMAWSFLLAHLLGLVNWAIPPDHMWWNIAFTSTMAASVPVAAVGFRLLAVRRPRLLLGGVVLYYVYFAARLAGMRQTAHEARGRAVKDAAARRRLG